MKAVPDPLDAADGVVSRFFVEIPADRIES
jgi:hypothetical protein